MQKMIEIPQMEGNLYYDATEVLCLQALDQYTLFYVLNPRLPEGYEIWKAGYGLGYFEPQMAKHGFLRVARNGIVNPRQVRRIMRDRTLILRIDCVRFIANPESCEQVRKMLRGEPINITPANPAQLSFAFNGSLAANR